MIAAVVPDVNAMAQRLIEQAGAPSRPADDMADLADPVRSLMGITAGRNTPVRLGGNLFDVVVTSSGAQARAAVALMDEAQGGCGPVVEDTRDGLLYWLVPPGTASRWEPHSHAVCLGAPHRITLPALETVTPPRTPGPYWFRRDAGDRLVPAGPLREVLTGFRPEPTPHAAFAGRLGATS